MSTRNKIISLSFILGGIIWVIDSIVDWMFYQTDTSEGLILFDVSGQELNMRIFILLSFVVFGFIMSKVISRKDKVEQELRISDIRFKEVAENAQEWIWEVDTEGIYTYSNSVVENILGYKPEELILKKHFYDLFDPTEKDEKRKTTLNVFNKKKPFKNFLKKNIHRNGNPIWLSTSGVPILDDGGNLMGYRGVDADITEHKLAEDSLVALTTTFSAFSSVDLFEKVSKHLTETLNMDYAFVGELIDTKQGVRVLGGFGKGKPLVQFEYALADTPCENVMGQSVCCYPKDVQKLFPKDYLLADMEIEGYIGAPIFAREGEASGIMVLLDSKPIQNPDIAQSLFNIFNERVSVEIERVKTEEALKESQQKLSLHIGHTPLGVIEWDINFIVTDWNKAAEKIFGYSQEEAIGKHPKSLILPENILPYLDEVWNALLTQKGGTRSTNENITKDGRTIICDWYNTPLANDEGKVIGVASLVEDITARQTVEKALKESEERFKSIYENATIGIYRSSPEGEMIMANPALIKMLGFTSFVELKSRGSVEKGFVNPSSRKRFKQKLESKGEVFNWEDEWLKSDGTPISVLESARTVVNENSHIIFYDGVVENISERKQAEKELRLSEEKFRGVYESITDMYYRSDMEGKIIMISPSCFNIIGYKHEEIIGKSLLEFYVRPEDRERLIENLKVKGSVNDFETEIYKKNGDIITILANVQLLKNEEGAPVFIEGMVRDITERKKSEQALLESLQTSADIVHSIPAGLFIYRYEEPDKLILIDANPEAEKLTQVKIEEARGKEFNELWPTAKERGITDSYLHVAKTGEMLSTDDLYYEDKRISGAFRIHVFTLPSQRLAVAFEDTTERKQAEQRLKESEKRSLVWLENSPACTKIVDLDFNLQYMSASGIKGLQIDDITQFYGKPYPFYFYPDSFKIPMTNNLRKVKETGKIITQEASVLDIKGNELWYHSTLVPVNDDEGQIDYIIVVSIDTTERRQAENDLKDSEKRFKTLSEATVEGILLSENGKIKDCNQQFADMMGYKMEEILGTITNDLVHPDDKESLSKINSDHEKAYQHRAICKNGKIIFVEVQARKIIYKCRKITMAAVHNITEHKIAQEALSLHQERLEQLVKERTNELESTNIKLNDEIIKQKEAELAVKTALVREQELNEMKTHFVSMVSHEFRTPLTSILTSADLLEMHGGKWTEEKRKKHLSKIQNSVDHMRIMLEDVLTLSRSDRGKIEFNPALLNLKKLCINSINDARNDTKDNHKLILNYQKTQDEFLLDEMLIKYIINNLLSNAIKYSPNGGDVILSVTGTKDNLLIEVSDEGMGINEDELENIFEAFTRTKNAVNIPGSGLGLSIVKESVELHGGNINVESKISEGSIFKIIIPVKNKHKK